MDRLLEGTERQEAAILRPEEGTDKGAEAVRHHQDGMEEVEEAMDRRRACEEDLHHHGLDHHLGMQMMLTTVAQPCLCPVQDPALRQ